MRRLAAVLAGVALLAAGCGGGGTNAQDVLQQTASSLGQIRSGTLTVHFLVTPQGKGQRFGFDLTGPFAFRRGRLPLARLVYTQIANGNQASATLVSAGGRAYVEANGTKRPLSPSQEQLLRNAGAQVSGAGGVGQLVVGDWLKDAKASSSGDTDKVTAQLDVAQAVQGMIGAARLSGRNVQDLSPADTKRLQQAVRSTSFVLYSGKQDHLLRELDMNADLGFDVPQQLRGALGSLVGAKVDFTLKVANPNKPVTIAG